MSSRQVFTVTGMSCEHCARAVTDEVQALPGVTGVDVDLGSGQVTVEAEQPVDAAAFAAAIDEAGYEVADGPQAGGGARSS